MEMFNHIRDRVPVGSVTNYFSEVFYSSTGFVYLNEFTQVHLCEVESATCILGCECLIRSLYNFSLFYQNLSFLVRSIIPTVDNFLKLCQHMSWNATVSSQRVSVTLPMSLCAQCRFKIVNIFEAVIKLLPAGTRFHLSTQNMEVCVESLLFGDSHLYAYISTLIFSIVAILHIPNLCVSTSFASVPLTQLNYFLQNPNNVEFFNALMRVSNCFSISFEPTNIIIKKHLIPGLGPIVKIYQDELVRRNLTKDNVRLTITAHEIKINRNAASFNADPAAHSERIFNGAEPNVVGPFVRFIEDAEDPANFPIAVLEEAVTGLRVPPGPVVAEIIETEEEGMSEIDFLDEIDFEGFDSDFDF